MIDQSKVDWEKANQLASLHRFEGLEEWGTSTLKIYQVKCSCGFTVASHISKDWVLERMADHFIGSTLAKAQVSE